MPTVLEQIVEWSKGRPAWQQDALRRLFVVGAVDGAALDALEKICLGARGLLKKEEIPLATALTSEDIPLEAGIAGAVQIREIREVRNANALAPDQRLSFSKDGLTIVYGDNGAGKSGYARILKKACRARDRGEKILPNVFFGTSVASASATIECVVGGKSVSHLWMEDKPAPKELGLMSFFDSACAAVHVRDANDVAFTPFGLDLLEKLAGICRQMRERLDAKKAQAEAQQPPSLVNPPLNAGGVVQQAISKMDFLALGKLRVLSDAEQQRIAELGEVKSKDPKKLAASLRSQAQRLRELLTLVEAAEVDVGDDVLENLRIHHAAMVRTDDAVRLAAGELSGASQLAGTGGDAWRELWLSARRFSAVAYPSVDFPAVSGEARCVLCHQGINSEAAVRLRQFEEFVRSDVQRKRGETKKAFELLLGRIRQSRVAQRASPGLLEELDGLSTSTHKLVRRFLVLSRWRRSRILANAGQGCFAGIPACAPTCRQALSEIISNVEARSREAGEAANEQKRQELLNELKALEERVWLVSAYPDVSKEILRTVQINAINLCIKDADMTGITRKAGELAEEVMTPALRDKFADELNRLGVSHLRVELVPATGRQGARRYQIRLIGAPKADVHKVASEGEHRCLALAGFLSELATASHASGLVFDDPVSSLDHIRREAIAKRLVEEASQRQVVIFTHDLVFVFLLFKYARNNKLTAKTQYISRVMTGGTPVAGVCDDDLPFRNKPPADVVAHLEKHANQIKALYESGKMTEYDERARALMGNIRETWESAVAEALSPVLRRFDRDVDTKRLLEIAVLTAEDCQEVDTGRTACAKYLHNESQAVNEPPPDPTIVLAEIERLRCWVEDVAERQKKVKKGR